jgi:ribosomal protein S21
VSVTVVVENGNVNEALKRLRKMVQQTGLVRDMRRHAEYVPPSTAKRVKSSLARKKARKVEQRRREREAQNPSVHPKDRG